MLACTQKLRRIIQSLQILFSVSAKRLFFSQNVSVRSGRPEVFCKRVVLKNFAKFTGKHLCESVFKIKLQVSETLS